MSLRVLLALNAPVLPPSHPDYASEVDIVETADEMEKILRELRYTVDRIAYARTPVPLMEKVQAFQPEVVLNLFEGEADRTETEISNAACLEWMDVPFTGAPSWAIALGRDKVRTKHLLQSAGLPTAPFQLVEHLPLQAWPYGWPAIVKPVYQDASVGIEQKSVVRTPEEMSAQVAHVFTHYGPPVIIEQYVPGREFHVNIYETPGPQPILERLCVLPIAELDFQLAPDEGQTYWPIYSYQAKWNEQSAECKATHIKTGIDLPPTLLAEIHTICKTAYRLIGMRDYGRVDIRLTPEGKPYILEVNPNPFLNSIILVEGMRQIGKHFNDLLQAILHNAHARRRGA